MIKEIRKVLSSSNDFAQCNSALLFLFGECDYKDSYPIEILRKFRCFETTAIISFSRPFIQSRNQRVLNLLNIGIRLSKQEKILKDKVISLRKKIFAHSDDEKFNFWYSLTVVNDFYIPFHRFNEGLFLIQNEHNKLLKLNQKLFFACLEYLKNKANENPDLYSKLGQYPIKPWVFKKQHE